MKSSIPHVRALTVTLALASTVSVVVAMSARTAAYGDYELWGYDFLINHQGSKTMLPEVVIVDFDDATFHRLKQYPIPRSAIADVITTVAVSSPKVIGMDIFLSEARSTREDAEMAKALGEAGNVIVASQAGAGGVPRLRPLQQFCDSETPSADTAYCKEVPKAAMGYAAVNLPVDSDGFVRSFFLFAGEANNGVSFPVMLAQLAQGVAITPRNQRAVTFQGKKIPTFPESARRVLIGTWCASCIKHISANVLLDRPGERLPELAQKIVLIGQSNNAARDLMLTPLFRPQPETGPRLRLSGVDVQAAAITTLLSGRAISTVPAAVFWLMLFGFALLSVWILLNYPLRLALMAIVVLMFVVYAASQELFIWKHIWIPYTSVLFSVAVSVPITVAYRFIQERIHRSAAMAERHQIMELFSRYVSRDAAQEIWDRRGEVVLAGEERIATVLFSDIRNFTASTAGKDSRIVLQWLNEYLSAMDEVIRAHGGFLNKFIGDGLMVLFGVPLSAGVEKDACRALRCACEMLARVEKLNRAGGPGDFPALKIGIGLHTGKLTCGSIGSRNRLEYSVIGETVNLASRLESLTKELYADVVMSAATHTAVKDSFPDVRELGAVSVRGFSGEMHLYGVTAANETSMRTQVSEV